MPKELLVIKNHGFSLVETVIAAAVFGLFATAFTGVSIYFLAPQSSGDRNRASFLADEALEATRAIKNDDWANLIYNQTGLDSSGTTWAFTGEASQEVIDSYVRYLVFSDVCRDVSKVITPCPSSYIDVNTKLVEAKVEWQGKSGGQVYSKKLYLTNWQEVEGIAPEDIITLVASNPATVSIDLAWTAPGDNENQGIASSYDIRYSTVIITDENWDSATEVIGEPAPSVAGTSESMIVGGLNPATTYYFAIKTSDEIPNESNLSNIVSETTLTASATIFHETFPNNDATWNGSSDTVQDESIWLISQGNGDLNDIQVSNEDIGASPSGGTHLTFEDCDQGWEALERYDLAHVNIDLSGYNSVSLEYYWQSDDVDNNEGMRVAYSVDSTDGINGTWTQLVEYNNPSPDDVWTVANFNIPDAVAVSTFMLRFSSKSNRTGEHMYIDDIKLTGTLDSTSPDNISDLTVSSPTDTSIDLDWTAPGDDGIIGTASSYDIRYFTSAITAGNWASALQVTGEPAPSVAGTSESMTVNDLGSGTTYYFAIKTSDEVPNESDLSNIDSDTTTGVADIISPDVISDLTVSSPTDTSIDLDWTAPGDDGIIGTASSYDIRYSTSIITEGNWNSATQVTGEPVPFVSGTSESMTVNGLNSGTTYYFAIKTLDEMPNESGLSNVPNLTTAAALVDIFHETFSSIDSAWNGSGDTSQDEPGWLVYQGNGDSNDVQVSNEDNNVSPSGGTHLTFEDCDQGWQSPESYDMAYVGIDLSSYNTVALEYYYQSDDVDNNEGMRVAYSTDTTDGINGTWTQLVEYNNPSPDDNWIIANFNIPDAVAVSTFMLRFSSKSNRAGEHMYVDDIKLIGFLN